nr:insertion element IS600 hypothetical 31 kDa protein [Bradyrhizobium sp. DOA9]
MSFRFIEDHGEAYPVRLMCAVLEVSPAGYYAWHERPASGRTTSNSMLLPEIRQVHRESGQRYGGPGLCGDVAPPWPDRTTDATACHPGDHVNATSGPRATDSCHDLPIAPNLIARDVTAAAFNRVWLADITYVPTAEGWLYPAAITDLFMAASDRPVHHDRDCRMWPTDSRSDGAPPSDQRALQAFGRVNEAFAANYDVGVLEPAIGQTEVMETMIERGSRDCHNQLAHVCEVGEAELARLVVWRKITSCSSPWIARQARIRRGTTDTGSGCVVASPRRPPPGVSQVPPSGSGRFRSGTPRSTGQVVAGCGEPSFAMEVRGLSQSDRRWAH